jgi:glycosyltransferase involved in cell wall biosynthesis
MALGRVRPDPDRCRHSNRQRRMPSNQGDRNNRLTHATSVPPRIGCGGRQERGALARDHRPARGHTRSLPLVIVPINRDAVPDIRVFELVDRYATDALLVIGRSVSLLTERRVREGSATRSAKISFIRARGVAELDLLAAVITASRPGDMLVLREGDRVGDLDERQWSSLPPLTSTVGTVGPDGAARWLYVRRTCAETVLSKLNRQPRKLDGHLLEQLQELAAAQGWRHFTIGRNSQLTSRPKAGREVDPVRAEPLADIGGRPRPIIIVTHDQGGGVAKAVESHAAALAALGHEIIALSPASDGRLCIAAADMKHFFEIPAQIGDIVEDLACRGAERVVFHHVLGHDRSCLRLPMLLGLPYDTYLHDFHFICPRVTLVNPHGHYCGEPSSAVCTSCIRADPRPILSAVDPQDLRDQFARFLSAADRVFAPSADVAARVSAHFGFNQISIVPHDDSAPCLVPRPARPSDLVVAVVGAIGRHKGFEVLATCAEDAARRQLPIRFTLVGHSIDDARLLATGRCFVTGEYAEGEAVDLLRREGANLGLIPSVWPEAWCFAMTELWRAGLHVCAFALGAPAARIRLAGRGTLLPLGLPAPKINDLLLREGQIETKHRKC